MAAIHDTTSRALDAVTLKRFLIAIGFFLCVRVGADLRDRAATDFRLARLERTSRILANIRAAGVTAQEDSALSVARAELIAGVGYEGLGELGTLADQGATTHLQYKANLFAIGALPWALLSLFAFRDLARGSARGADAFRQCWTLAPLQGAIVAFMLPAAPISEATFEASFAFFALGLTMLFLIPELLRDLGVLRRTEPEAAGRSTLS